MTTTAFEKDTSRHRFINDHVPHTTDRELILRRVTECLAMSMIGDGFLGFVEPRRHVDLWFKGPKWWRQMLLPFARRPELTRWVVRGRSGRWFLAGLTTKAVIMQRSHDLLKPLQHELNGAARRLRRRVLHWSPPPPTGIPEYPRKYAVFAPSTSLRRRSPVRRPCSSS